MQLVIAGCSFSGYTRVHKNYGDFLSEKLKLPVLQLVKGCAGNDFIVRNLITNIRNGVITSDDILIIQYTTKERKEFWVDVPRLGNFQEKIFEKKEINCRYGDGRLSFFKVDSHNWEENGVEELHKAYETYSCGTDYDTEVFENTHFMLVNTLLRLGIKAIFLHTPYIGDLLPNIIKTNLNENIKVFDGLNYGLQYPLGLDDTSHLSQQGHKILAEDLFTFIQTNYSLDR